MIDFVPFLTLAVALLTAAISAILLSRRRAVGGQPGLSQEQATGLFRGEHDRLRDAVDAQFPGMRTELADVMRGLQDSGVRNFGELGKLLETQAAGIGERVEGGVGRIEAQTRGIGDKLDTELKTMAHEATANRDRLRSAIEERLGIAATAQAEAARTSNEQLLKSIDDNGKGSAELISRIGEHQKERLDTVARALGDLTIQQGGKLEAVRKTVEERLDVLRKENTAKLEEMRQTVDEKLKATLEQRLGDSFTRVVEQLERVHAGIGEMKTLANGVGDLKKVLSNVTVRGALGQIQLAMLLEQFLSPEQLIRNAVVRENSQERVEFAVRLPGRDGENEVLLPIDAKFPQEDYQRLLDASDKGDVDAVVAAGQALEARIRQFARTIREKYILPPRTTDFAVLFLPDRGSLCGGSAAPGPVRAAAARAPCDPSRADDADSSAQCFADGLPVGGDRTPLERSLAGAGSRPNGVQQIQRSRGKDRPAAQLRRQFSRGLGCADPSDEPEAEQCGFIASPGGHGAPRIRRAGHSHQRRWK
jgi:DNA recombination protein RmuC